MLGKKSQPQKVTNGRFEIEQDGHTAYLEYTLTNNILTLSHTEIPQQLRGRGLSSELATTALDWAREHHLKVDVVCPSVAGFIQRHSEYSDLVLR